jgi:hypothetical protein
LLAETALHHRIDPGAPGHRYQVVVHIDAPALADAEAPGQSVLENGEHVSAETSRRLGCDARPGSSHPSQGPGRPTTLSNLTMLCRRHDRAVHEEGYRVERDPAASCGFDDRTDGLLLKSRRLPRRPAIR